MLPASAGMARSHSPAYRRQTVAQQCTDIGGEAGEEALAVGCVEYMRAASLCQPRSQFSVSAGSSVAGAGPSRRVGQSGRSVQPSSKLPVRRLRLPLPSMKVQVLLLQQLLLLLLLPRLQLTARAASGRRWRMTGSASGQAAHAIGGRPHSLGAAQPQATHGGQQGDDAMTRQGTSLRSMHLDKTRDPLTDSGNTHFVVVTPFSVRRRMVRSPFAATIRL